jgi:hypothetical protein
MYVQTNINMQLEWVEVDPEDINDNFEWLDDVDNVGMSGDFSDINDPPAFTTKFPYGDFPDMNAIEAYANSQGW